MANSKEQILASVRRQRSTNVELPELNRKWTTYQDRRQQFIAVLEMVGGQAINLSSHAQLEEAIRQLPVVSQMQKIASLVPKVPSTNLDWTTIDSPHALADVDLAVLPGELAVAENAAVWVSDRQVPWRVLYFLCQHLVLVVPANEIVDHMHAAYEQMSAKGILAEPMFGAFISGPSKTADIEQSLVIGAHGPRSLTVFLVGE